MPDDKVAPPAPWDDSMVRCYKDGRVEKAIDIDMSGSAEIPANQDG